TPIFSRRSWALAERTQIPVAADRSQGSRSDSTTSPLGAAVRSSPSSSRSVCTLFLGQQCLPGELHAAALVHLEQLDLDDVTLLDDIFGLLGAAVLQLADVQQPLDARQDLDERAERRGALDRPFVDLPAFGLGGDGRDHGTRLLTARATGGGDGDEPAVLDAGLGGGGALTTPPRLALGPDPAADLARPGLDRDDPRCVLVQVRARLRQ